LARGVFVALGAGIGGVISDAVAFAVIAVFMAIAGAITALLVLNGKRKLAGIITAGLGIGAVVSLLCAYTIDDDYAPLFLLFAAELAGLLSVGGLMGLVMGLIVQRKRGR
jgi:hypothetical protein